MQATTTAAQTTIAIVINWGYWIFSPLITIHQWTSYMLARWSGVFKMVSRAYQSLITPLGIMAHRLLPGLATVFNTLRNLGNISIIGILPKMFLEHCYVKGWLTRPEVNLQG